MFHQMTRTAPPHVRNRCDIVSSYLRAPAIQNCSLKDNQILDHKAQDRRLCAMTPSPLEGFPGQNVGDTYPGYAGTEDRQARDAIHHQEIMRTKRADGLRERNSSSARHSECLDIPTGNVKNPQESGTN